MPVKQHRPQPEIASAPTVATPSSETTPAVSNAVVQEKAGLAKLSAGQISWQDALGESLGSKLYEQVSDQLSDADLQSAASKAVDAAVDQLRGFLKDNTEASEQQAAAMFVKALDAQLQRIAKQAVSGDVGEAIRGFVDDSPLLVTSAAVAGAIAWVLSNQDLGLIDSKIKIGGAHSVVAGVDLGKTMDIALQQVRLGYRYSGSGTKAEITADYFMDDERFEVLGKVEHDLGHGTASLRGKHTDGPEGSNTRFDAGYGNKNLTAGMWWAKDSGLDGDRETMGANLTAKQNDWSAHVNGQGSSDGSWEAAAGFNKNLDNKSWGVEGYANENQFGQKDAGVRATFKWKF